MKKSTLQNTAILDADLASVDFSIQVFGDFLRAVRRAKRISIRDFEALMGKTRSYLSDIECNKSRPPDKALLDLMIVHLNVGENVRIVNRLYDLAAIGRNAVPDDLKDWIMENEVHRDLVRECRNKKLTSAQIGGLLKVMEEM